MFKINLKYKSILQNFLKKGFLKNYHLIMIFFMISFVANAQVSVKVDTTKIRIGEQIQYQIFADKDSVNEIFFPKLNLDSLKRIELVEAFDIDSVKNKFFRKYILTSFDSGRYMIPKQSVLINDISYLVDSIFIDVSNITVDTIKQKMYPIKTIKKEPYTFDDYKNYLWWLLGLLLLIAVIVYFIRRKKPTKEEIEEKIPPFDLAKQRLKELDNKNLLQQNRIKLYYVELTDIIRSFIEKDLNIPALESTTDELIETITDFNDSSNLNIPKEPVSKLKRLLQEADLVKFAKSKPLLNTTDLHRKDAETIIEKMHPKVEKKEENDGE